jgi:2'-5' RNA ligase
MKNKQIPGLPSLQERGTRGEIPGYNIYEYLLVINPHEELRQKIVAIKNNFYQTYQAETAKWGKPHVTLVTFKQYQLVEQRIINHLKTIALGFKPIKIELNQFGSFPSHTIYINVATKTPLQNLVKQIRADTQRLMKLNDDNKPHFIVEPHITIARKLLPWQYEKGWLEYSHKHFTAKFIADGMLLLKRPVGQLQYEIVQRFNFENLAVATTMQGDLFSP